MAIQHSQLYVQAATPQDSGNECVYIRSNRFANRVRRWYRGRKSKKQKKKKKKENKKKKILERRDESQQDVGPYRSKRFPSLFLSSWLFPALFCQTSSIIIALLAHQRVSNRRQEIYRSTTGQRRNENKTTKKTKIHHPRKKKRS